MAASDFQDHVARKLERVMAQPVSGLAVRLRAELGTDVLEQALLTDYEEKRRREAARKRLGPGALPTPPPRVCRDLGMD